MAASGPFTSRMLVPVTQRFARRGAKARRVLRPASGWRRARRPVVGQRDQFVAGSGDEGALRDVARAGAAHDPVREQLLAPGFQPLAVRDEGGVDAALLALRVHVDDVVGAVRQQRVEPLGQGLQGMAVLDLADAEQVGALAVAHSRDDSRQLRHLALEQLRGPASQVVAQPVGQPGFALGVALGREQVFQVPERHQIVHRIVLHAARPATRPRLVTRGLFRPQVAAS